MACSDEMDLNCSSENIFLSQIPLDFELENISDNVVYSQMVSDFENSIDRNSSFDLGLDFLEDPEILNNSTRFQTNVLKLETNRCVETVRSEINDERFGKQVTDTEIEEMKSSKRNKNTAKNTKWAFNIFETWRQHRQADNIPEIHIMEKPALSFWLIRFLMEVRNQKGEEYPPKSLYLIMCGLLRHLRECGVHDKNILDKKDPAFAELITILDSKMKHLLDQGLGTKTKQADPVSNEDEEKLWEKGVFGMKNSKSLQYTVFFYACKLFGLRGRDEHRNLQCNQFEIGEDDGGRFIRFIGRGSKTYHGGLGQMSIKNKDIKHYCKPGMFFSIRNILIY